MNICRWHHSFLVGSRGICCKKVHGNDPRELIYVCTIHDAGEWLPSINHSPWNIVTLADFVMPYFLFMVGCSMSLAFRKYHKGLLKKVFTRTAKLFILGLLTQGSDFPSLGTHGINLKTVRIPGILQRIAWAYFVVALIVMYVPKIDVATASNGKRSYFYAFRVHAYQWAAASFFFWIYLVVSEVRLALLLRWAIILLCVKCVDLQYFDTQIYVG